MMTKWFYRITFVALLLSFFDNCYCQINCKPNGYRQRVRNDSTSNYFSQTLWLFDDNGRLVIDSIYPVNSNQPHSTTYYRYNKDSIIGAGNYGYGVLILLNEKGLPIFTSDIMQRTFSATYNEDNTLKSVQETDFGVRQGALAMDSFIYSNGNIISYREVYWNTSVSHIVLTYYEDKYKDSLYFGLKPFALRLHRFFITYIDIQSFSKNLLKSKTRIDEGRPVDNITSYNYSFDSLGKATKLRRVVYYPTEDKEQISHIEFLYPCDK